MQWQGGDPGSQAPGSQAPQASQGTLPFPAFAAPPLAPQAPPQPPYAPRLPGAPSDEAIAAAASLLGPEAWLPAVVSEDLASSGRLLADPRVRRDIYRVLYHPAAPGAPRANRVPTVGACALGAQLCMTSGAVRFAGAQAVLPAGWQPVPSTAQGIATVGENSALGVALASAFEGFVAALARGWTEQDTARLSPLFLVALGNELTNRLNITNAICSRYLPDDDLRALLQPPFRQYVDENILRAFQGSDRCRQAARSGPPSGAQSRNRSARASHDEMQH